MPLASVVVCHGGHGTVARALAAGAPVLTSPAVGDMAETAARISWSGVGLSVPWRICGPRPLRWAVRELLGKPSYAVGARELARWSAENDGAERGAELVEQLADDA
jgi:UDP:flavonoid glycosyltransferase YjiC (YdhE family)